MIAPVSVLLISVNLPNPLYPRSTWFLFDEICVRYNLIIGFVCRGAIGPAKAEFDANAKSYHRAVGQ